MMRRVLLGVLVIGLVAGIGVLFWKLEDGETPPPAPASAGKTEARPEARTPPARSVDLPGAPTFEADKDPQGPLRLEGQVLGEGDIGVGRATVFIDSSPRRTVTTEEDGSFFFDHMVGRTYTIGARAGDRAGGPVMHELTASSEPVVVRLRAGASVAVTVVAEEGARPLAGATVKLRTKEERAATTDAKGLARFRGVLEGSKVVTASAPGYAAGRRIISVPRDARVPVATRLTLKAGVPVSGRVVDEAGALVAGARVAPLQMADLLAELSRKAQDPVKTDDKGRFSIAALSPGTYRIVAEHREHAPGSSRPVVVGSSPVRDVSISLKAGAVLAGKVVTARGDPAPWASVRLGPDRSGHGKRALIRHRRATADKYGAFRLTGLPRARVVVAASAEGASSQIVTVDLTVREKVENLSLALDQLGVISGTVVNGAGAPVPEAQVTALPDIFAKGAMTRLVLGGLGGQITDGGGGFSFRGLPGGKYRLRASRGGVTRRTFLQKKGIAARTGDTGVKLVLEEPGGIKGGVQDRAGRPVTTFTVTAGQPPGTPVVDDGGRFEVRGIPPGKVDVTVRTSGHASASRKQVAVTSGKVADVGVLTVSRGRVVSGRVLDAAGSPVAGADVVVGNKIVGDGRSLLADLGKAFEEATGIRRARSDENGAFTVAGISEGPQLIAADHARSGRSAPRAVPPGKEDVKADLRLLPMGSLHGEVTYGKKPAPGVIVVVSQKASRKQSLLVKTDSEGLYLVERLPAGTYDLMAMSKAGLGGKSSGAVVKVEAGRRARADMHLEAGEITLRVKILGAGGAKIDLAQVFLFRGGLSPINGKQVQEAFLGKAKGGGAMMAFAKPPSGAQFKQVAPAAYSVCALPIAGDIHDAAFRARLQKHADKLKVHCRPYTVKSAPASQSFSATVPPMAPLPAEKEGEAGK